ncbi:DUF397 domain-containing protein [Streptomyces sp. B3I7]|uniref:DUF397 domain-containing protein n=1 Tax=Streptomyces sp. B3I7 TaxID=3042269 RepID=UPI0027D7C31F|nr:DUF397 domain-containing protein [Streptomyces sp. B3I7]
MAENSNHSWIKSSYSGGSGTECVECAATARSTLIRDSKWRNGPFIAVRTSTWNIFLRTVKAR